VPIPGTDEPSEPPGAPARRLSQRSGAGPVDVRDAYFFLPFLPFLLFFFFAMGDLPSDRSTPLSAITTPRYVNASLPQGQ